MFASLEVFILSKTKKNIGVFIFFLFAVLFFYIHGSIYKEKFVKEAEKNFDYKIRTIGSNISLDRFYKDVDTASIIQDLIKISNPIFNEKTIFVWPEGILPKISKEDSIKYSKLFSEQFSENHLLIIGSNTQSIISGSKVYYNSLTIFDNKLNIIDSYNKINLVPFGEFLPLENILKNIGLRSLTNNYQSFSRGEERKIIEIKKDSFSLRILPLICYEIIYSGNLFNNSNYDLIINISEDGWFGQSIGPKQHFVHSIFRAIENGKYIVRSSNNGLAGIINPLGEVEQIVKFGHSGFVDLKVNKTLQSTPFSKYGNKIFLILILLYIFLIFSFNKIKDE